MRGNEAIPWYIERRPRADSLEKVMISQEEEKKMELSQREAREKAKEKNKLKKDMAKKRAQQKKAQQAGKSIADKDVS